MAYRSVCRCGRAGGGRVRQDDISIADDILPRMSENERREMMALRRTNPGMFRKRIQDYKNNHRTEIRQIIANHDAGGASPGILRFIEEVVRRTPSTNVPAKPGDFPIDVRIETHPGRRSTDVHLEGRAADVYFNISYPNQLRWGSWLFDYCVANCERYKIQGVIFGKRQWFSETQGGQILPRTEGDHDNHVHIELNCDGANLR